MTSFGVESKQKTKVTYVVHRTHPWYEYVIPTIRAYLAYGWQQIKWAFTIV